MIRCSKLINSKVGIDPSNPSECFRISKVGVGLLSPGYWFDVYGTEHFPGQQAMELRNYLVTEAMDKKDFTRVTEDGGCEQVEGFQTSYPPATDNNATINRRIYLDQVEIGKFYENEFKAIQFNIKYGLSAYVTVKQKYPMALSSIDKPMTWETNALENNADQKDLVKLNIYNARDRFNSNTLRAQVIKIIY